MAAAVKYSLSDFYNVNSSGFKVILPDDVVIQINELVKQVGSPNYIRTPVFQKAPKMFVSNNRKRKEFKSNTNTDELWNNMTKHPAPKEEEKKENEVSVQLIRSFLNKLTDKNIEEISNKIIDKVEIVLKQKDMEMMDSIANLESNLNELRDKVMQMPNNQTEVDNIPETSEDHLEINKTI